MHQVVPALLASFGWDTIPARRLSPKKFEWEPQNRPSFSPHPRPHPLKPLTCGPPPMYWLVISWWCPSPLCMLHFIWTLFLFGLHTISAISVFVWFYCMRWLVFIFCGVKDVWAFELIFLTFYPFLDWALLGQNPLSSCQAHVLLFYVRGLFCYWSFHIALSYLL